MKNFKPWYLAQMSLGVVQWTCVALMLTSLIIERTGSGALMGSVMSLIGLFGISAPLIGWLADKYGIHRQLQKLALLAHLLALVMLYFAGAQPYVYLLVGLSIGVGTVSQLVLNPTFVLTSLPPEQHGLGLSRLFQSQFFGIVVSAGLLGTVKMLSWSVEAQLLLLMGLVVFSLLVVTIAPPPKVAIAAESSDSEQQESTASKAVNGKAFVAFLATVFISMFTASNLMESGPIVIEQVFSVEMGHSAFGVAASAVLTILLLEPAGRWVEKSGPYQVWVVALFCYAITAIGLWLAVGSSVPAALPILLIVLLMQAISWFDMVIPAIAEELSPCTPALTQGLLMFAMAVGFGVGTLIAGQLIDLNGFVAVIDFSAESIVVTLVLSAFTLYWRKRGQVQ